MDVSRLLHPVNRFTPPPPGAVNVCRGVAIEGPGGRWVPCATQVSDGTYLSALFEVGPGKRQVCLDMPVLSAEEALKRATHLASAAAA